MLTKVIIFENTTQNIDDFLHEHGIFDMLYCYSFEDCLSVCKKVCEEAQNVVILCKNDQIDPLVEKLKTNEDVLSLINDQAVKMERQTIIKNVFFLPFEADYENLLESILPKKEQYISAVFGKSESFLKEKLELLKQDGDFDYHIVAKDAFLHIVYLTKPIDKQVFEGGCYSNKNQSLASALKTALQDKSLAVVEQMTGGRLISKISSSCKENIVGAELIFCDSDFEKVQLDELFLEQNGTVSKETAFAMAKNLLKKYKTDFALAFVGFDCDAGRSFVAVGNSEQINVYSSVFYGSKEEIVENSTNFAIFKTICLLNEKDK